MDKNKKIIIFSIIGALVLLLCGTIPLLTWFVEMRVENVIRQTATKLTGSEMTIGEVSYDLWKTRLTLSELALQNPPGYSAGSALSLTSIALDLQPFTIFKNELHIQELSVDGVTFFPEFRSTPYTSEALLELILKREINFLEFTKKKGKDVRKQGSVKSASKKTSSSPLYIRIDSLSITNCKATLKNYTVIPQEWKTLSLPDYTVKNIGADEKITVEQLAGKIFSMHAEKIRTDLKDKVDRLMTLVGEIKTKIKETAERLKDKNLTFAERKKLLVELKNYALELAKLNGVKIELRP